MAGGRGDGSVTRPLFAGTEVTGIDSQLPAAMPSDFPQSPAPFLARDWFRFVVVCATNFSILAAPFHGAGGETVRLPVSISDDDMLLAVLLPDLSENVLDAGGSVRTEPVPSPFEWRMPEPNRYGRAPQPGRKTSLLSQWQAPSRRQAIAAAPAVMIQAPANDGPWIPAPVPAGADPTQPTGVIGALPIERQTGNCEVFGEVSDATNLNPIAGAIVDIIGTGRVAQTDAQGKFRITGLPAGDFAAEVSTLNHESMTLGVSPNPAAPTELRFSLRVKPAESGSEEYVLEEESIVGEFTERSQGDFNLTLQTEAPSLTAGIGRDAFSKEALSDAGQAVAKISGANIVDGKYAVVRGLADRYVTTTFNGGQIASADPSRKAVQLDLFPTGVIEAINADKTYSADLPGDFGGAVIDIVTRAFPEERILNFKAKVEWNSALGDQMYVHPSRSLGFWGETGSEMPNYLEGRDPATGNVVFYPTPDMPTEESQERMQKLHRSQSLLPVLDDPEEDKSYSLTYGETFMLGNGMKFGVIAAFNQSSGDSTNDSDINNQDRSFYKSDWERGVELSAFISAALEMNDLNRIKATYFNKHDAKDVVTQGTRLTGTSKDYGRIVDYSVSPIVRDTYGADAVYSREFWDIETVTRDLEIFQLQGEHAVTEGGVRLDWSISESNAQEKRPHSSHFEYGLLDFSEKALAPAVEAATGRLDQLIKDNAGGLGLDPETATWGNSREYLVGLLGEETVASIETSQGMPVVDGSIGVIKTVYPIAGLIGQAERTISAFRRKDSTEEDASHRQMALTLPFKLDDDSDKRLFEIGIGASKLRKSRDISARVYSLVTAETNGNFSEPGTIDGPGEDLVTNPGGLGDLITGDITTGPYYAYGVGDAGVENLSTVLDQNSLFVSGRLQWDDFFFSAGVRGEKEKYEIDIASAPLVPFPDSTIEALGWEYREDQEALLPSFITGKSFFDDKLDLMVAWSRTVARPTFWEFLPTTSVDQSSGIVRRGNVALDRTEITNFDLSATLRPTEDLVFRTSLFHKDLDRPLVQVFSGDGIIYRDSTASASGGGQDYTATLSGIELEAEVNHLGPFSLRGNFTYIDATLNYFFEGGGVISPVTSQLPYQPAYIANATLGYEHEPWGLTANLVFNFNGEYPTILQESEDQSEVTREALATWDLIVSKKIETDMADWTLRCGVKNLLEADDRYVYDGRTYSNDTIGRTFFLETEIAF
jgi:hypothetical protein